MERGTRDRNRRSLWAVGALLLLVSGLWAGALLQRGSEEPSLASAGPDRLFAPRAGVAGLAASIAGGSAAAGHMLGGRASQARRLGGAWEDAPDGSDAAAAAPGSIAAQPGGRCAPERPGAPPPTPRRRRALEPLAAEGAGRSLGPPPGAAPYPWAYPAPRRSPSTEAASGASAAGSHRGSRLPPVPVASGIREVGRRSPEPGGSSATDGTVYQIQTDRSKAFALVEGKGPHQGEPPAAEASRVDLGGGSGNAGREPAEGRDGAFPR